MRYFVEVAGKEWEVVVEAGAVQVDGNEVSARLLDGPSGDPVALEVGGSTHSLVVGPDEGGRRVLHVDGLRHDVRAETERDRRVREMRGIAGGTRGPRPLKAPMPGLVVRVEVETGDAVAEGDGLLIVEAMKMENELRAEAAAVVSRVHVEAGQAVEKDQMLVEFEAPDDEADS